MVAHEWLGHAELLHEVAHAQLLAGEQLDDAPPRRLGQRPQHVGPLWPIRLDINSHAYVPWLMESPPSSELLAADPGFRTPASRGTTMVR